MGKYAMTRAYKHADKSGMDQLFTNPQAPEWYASQIPLYSDIKRAEDTGRFYADYYKNTGIVARYPYMTFPSYGTQLAYSALGMMSHSGLKMFSPRALYG